MHTPQNAESQVGGCAMGDVLHTYPIPVLPAQGLAGRQCHRKDQIMRWSSHLAQYCHSSVLYRYGHDRKCLLKKGNLKIYILKK